MIFRIQPVAKLLACFAASLGRLRHLRAAGRPTRRATLHDLHASGHLSVFRRPSIFRVWEPLRERPRTERDSAEQES